MIGTLFSTPRDEPNHLLPAIGSALVLALAVPVFVISGWPLSGWALAAVLWVGVHALDQVLARARGETDSLAASGVQAFALFFKSIGLLVVLLAAVAADRNVGLAAAVTYALGYTFELGLSLVLSFGGGRRGGAAQRGCPAAPRGGRPRRPCPRGRGRAACARRFRRARTARAARAGCFPLPPAARATRSRRPSSPAT